MSDVVLVLHVYAGVTLAVIPEWNSHSWMDAGIDCNDAGIAKAIEGNQ